MSFSYSASGSHLILAGRLDAQNAAELRQTIRDHVAAHTGNVTADLSDVPFMDSSALAALVAALKDCRRQGRTLSLTGASASVRELLSLTMLDRIFGLSVSGVRP
ncbi:STAS domain-containing protein [Deinococcus aquaticus]|uniref:Anti-sigma factor antagonist n=1 Tax=Deinococcus aquaticus TaxID=328692 RepID=A0ABY7V6C0_9DEIO|nr:STAS domain-containing protein [Deinococcus aquaticus]WDA60275.1 STAS domain-containing protein [Deinococcus aquaticus]